VDQDVDTDVIYDFLYRDTSRIASYYAQVFGGRLTSFEKSEAERESGDRTGKLTVPVLGLEGKLTKETGSGLKQVFDAHDMVAANVLAALSKAGRLNKDVEAAPHGALVLAQGSLIFLDKAMMDMAAMTFDVMLTAETKKPKHQRNTEMVNNLTITLSFLKAVTIPSAFLLRSTSGRLLCGTIKDDGMEEPISTYYFKHGTAGLSDVLLVGVKEIPSTTFAITGQQLFGAAQKAAAALSEMLFPKDAVRVTPIVLFRKV